MPTSHDGKALGAAVGALSAYYNGLTPEPPPGGGLGARLVFSFPRDTPKSAGAVAELILTGRLRLGDAPLRVLDLGAGLGASTWGLVRALAAAGQKGVVEAHLVDQDPRALAIAAQINAQVRGEAGVELRVRTSSGDLRSAGAHLHADADVILVGQALSEVDRKQPPAGRADAHAALLGELLQRGLAPGGSLVVIEPALRDRTRHLHLIRERLVAAGWPPFAPCLHARACPMLATEGDWCHEDLPLDLPPWLVPAARAAGLRFQGLTFSYLVARRDGASLRASLPAGALRLVESLRVTKGKRDGLLCGDVSPETSSVRAVRLDRDRTPGNEAWDALQRGDLVVISPPPSAAEPRFRAAATVASASPLPEPL